MKKSTHAVIAAGVAGALALTATPAFAAAYSGANVTFTDANNTYWAFDTFTSASLDGLWSTPWENASDGDDSTWDDTTVQLGSTVDDSYYDVTCTDPADLSTASDGSGDQIVLCDPVDITTASGVLTAQIEFRFYADLKTVRTRLIVKNNTTASISDAMAWMDYNAYQDDETMIYAATNSAPSFTDPVTSPSYVTTAADLRWVTDNRLQSYNDAPVVNYAIGRTGAAVLPTDDATINAVSGGQGYNANDTTNTYFQIPTLAAGESIEFVTMAQVYLPLGSTTSGSLTAWETATKAADEAAWADTTIDSDALVFAGIADPSKVLNWSPAKTPDLPNTGLDVAGFTGLALALLVAGAGVVVVRRRAHA